MSKPHLRINRWVGTGETDKTRWWAVFDHSPGVSWRASGYPICLRKTRAACETFVMRFMKDRRNERAQGKRRHARLVRQGYFSHP